MAAAVVDLDLANGIPDVRELERYLRAFVVLRWRGVPFGHVWLPIVNGSLRPDAIADAVTRRLLPEFSRRWADAEVAPAPAASSTPTATIAICTRDRATDLDRALAALTPLYGGRHPILVVDNRPSTDASQAVVAKYPGVEYLREDRPGLDNARNRALRHARTAVVAFTDDDAVPEDGWLEALLGNFRHPLVLAVTGLTLPRELETEAQETFERYSPFGRGYFRREFDQMEVSPHAAGSMGAGVNMALRREVVDLVGPFDPSLDAGTPSRSGGDHDMFSRILLRGYRVVYDPAAVSWHVHRRTWAELEQTIEGYGTGVYAMWTGRLLRGDLGIVKEAARWLAREQVPALGRGLIGRPGAAPARLVLAELRGCALGPLAWLRSRRLREVPAS